MNTFTAKKNFMPIIILVIIAIVFYVLWMAGLVATVRPIEDAKTVKPGDLGSSSEAAQDQTSYVGKIWDSKLMPTVKEKAVDLNTLMDGLVTDEAGTSKKYGNKVGGPYNFLVKFEGTVKEVNTASRVGKVTLDVPLKSARPTVILQIGPVMQGYSVRDAVGFISFEQFTNQIEFADVADQINTRLYEQVIKAIDFKAAQGKTLSIYGAFTLDSGLTKLVVTPVIIEVK
jgi:predicted lipoprotein